jgi:hypothetical protein
VRAICAHTLAAFSSSSSGFIGGKFMGSAALVGSAATLASNLALFLTGH